MTIHFFKGALAGLLALSVCGSALAAPKPAQAAAGVKPPAYDVTGFRSAHFGDSQDKVIAAIAHDFGVKPADIQHINVPSDGTTALAVTQPQMAPAPGAVTITYVLGKPGLIHVNVVWLLTGDVSPVQRVGLVAGGVKLSDYFKTFSWVPGKSGADLAVGPNSVVMFLGFDSHGNAVEVRADGVPYQRTVAGKAVQSPVPSGSARLRVAYASAATKTAVTTIKPGQF